MARERFPAPPPVPEGLRPLTAAEEARVRELLATRPDAAAGEELDAITVAVGAGYVFRVWELDYEWEEYSAEHAIRWALAELGRPPMVLGRIAERGDHS